MFKTVWNFLLIAPLATWSASLLSSVAFAAEPASKLAQSSSSPVEAIVPESTTNLQLSDVDAVMQQVQAVSQLETPETDEESAMTQVTSVSQLTDVKPTDWAFQALQSLVERYGCIIGYPDKTYRGNRALSRYEFAAGLNACLDRVNELIAAATSDLVKKQDLETLRKLQEEFATELAALRGRLDALEARTATLEKQQFSATTKLNALLWFNLTGAFVGDSVTAERRFPANAFAAPVRNPVTRQPSRVQRQEPEVTLSYYTWLTFNTSFSGKDSLITQLAVGNGSSPANQLVSAGFFNSWGVPFTDQSGTPNPGSVVIRELAYTFPLTNNVRVAFGPRLNYYRYFDGNRFTGFLTGAGSFNSSGSTLLNAADRGSGAVAIWNLSKQLRFTVGYLAESTEFLNSAVFNTPSNPADGLFNATNTITGEIAFSPSPNFNLRVNYTRSNIKAYNGFIGGAVGEPLPYGYADDGFGGFVNDAIADAFVVNFDWLITRGIGIFGRYSYGSTNIDPVNPLRPEGEVNVQSFQIGLGFPDLGKKGALGVISFLVPHDFLDGREFLLSGGGDGGTQYELEASYYFPLTNNIALVPAFYTIWNANNFDSNPTVYVGNLRAQFSF